MQNLMSCNTREEAKKRLRNAGKQHLSLPKYSKNARRAMARNPRQDIHAGRQAASDCAISEYMNDDALFSQIH